MTPVVKDRNVLKRTDCPLNYESLTRRVGVIFGRHRFIRRVMNIFVSVPEKNLQAYLITCVGPVGTSSLNITWIGKNFMILQLPGCQWQVTGCHCYWMGGASQDRPQIYVCIYIYIYMYILQKMQANKQTNKKKSKPSKRSNCLFPKFSKFFIFIKLFLRLKAESQW